MDVYFCIAMSTNTNGSMSWILFSLILITSAEHRRLKWCQGAFMAFLLTYTNTLHCELMTLGTLLLQHKLEKVWKISRQKYLKWIKIRQQIAGKSFGGLKSQMSNRIGTLLATWWHRSFILMKEIKLAFFIWMSARFSTWNWWSWLSNNTTYLAAWQAEWSGHKPVVLCETFILRNIPKVVFPTRRIQCVVFTQAKVARMLLKGKRICGCVALSCGGAVSVAWQQQCW